MEKKIEKKPSAKRRRRLAFILPLLVIAGVIGLLFYLQYQKIHISTDDTYVDGRVHVVAPKVSGTIAALYVRDNQLVKKGDPLVDIDPVDYEVRLRGASRAWRGNGQS